MCILATYKLITFIYINTSTVEKQCILFEKLLEINSNHQKISYRKLSGLK